MRNFEDFVKSISQKFTGRNIAVFGDSILDTYVHGRVDRISPEAPVPVFKEERREYVLGGAANVALGIDRLGATAHLFSALGAEGDGSSELRKTSSSLRSQPNCDHFILMPDRPMTEKTRFVAGGQQIMRFDKESTAPMAGCDDFFLDKFLQIHDETPFGAIVISDYDKGFLTEGLLEGIFDIGLHKNIPMLVDPAIYRGLDIYAGAHYITPNKKEAEIAMKFRPGEKPSQAICQEFPFRGHVVITCGAEGMYASKYEDPSVHHISAKAKSVYDVSGAGDTVIAALAVGVAARMEFTEACEFSSYAAATAVGKLGTYAPTLEEVFKDNSADAFDLELV